jgi:hypothetical protein
MMAGDERQGGKGTNLSRARRYGCSDVQVCARSAAGKAVDCFTFRFGVNNITGRQPSYLTLRYGDAIGRSYFVGTEVKF